MELTVEQADYLAAHHWAALATGRKDGSPQMSMIGYAWDGQSIIVSFRRYSAKHHNISRQARVALLVPDGRRALTVYGDAEVLEDDPRRVDAFSKMLASFGAPAASHDELARQMDEEARVVVRIAPASADLHE